MQKKLLSLGLGICLTTVFLFSGCSKTQKEETTSEAQTTATDEESAIFDYKVSDYLELGPYTGLTLDLAKTEITDEDVEEKIKSDLEENKTQNKITNRGVQDEDYVDISFTCSVDGKDYKDASGENYELLIGSEELGAEFDKALLGAKTGDKVEAKTLLSEDYGDDAGKEAVYTITLNSIYLYKIPKLTKTYAKETLGYESIDAYKEVVKNELYNSKEKENRANTYNLALTMIVENSEVKDYPKDLYDYYYAQMEELYAYYASMFNVEVSQMISDEDLENSVKEIVADSMVTKAIAEKENITVTDEIYQKYLIDNLSSYGYDSAEELEEAEGKTSLRQTVLSNLVQEFLLKNNTLNEITQEKFNEMYGDSETESEE